MMVASRQSSAELRRAGARPGDVRNGEYSGLPWVLASMLLCLCTLLLAPPAVAFSGVVVPARFVLKAKPGDRITKGQKVAELEKKISQSKHRVAQKSTASEAKP